MPKEDADKVLAYRPGLWVLTGTFSWAIKKRAMVASLLHACCSIQKVNGAITCA
jgi:hypothetical protein